MGDETRRDAPRGARGRHVYASPARFVNERDRRERDRRCSEQPPCSEGARERGHHAIARERMLFAQELDDSVDVAVGGGNDIVVADLGGEVDLAKPAQIGAEPLSNVRWHLVQPTMTAHECQRFLRSDSADSGMKVRSDQQTHIDQLRA